MKVPVHVETMYLVDFFLQYLHLDRYRMLLNIHRLHTLLANFCNGELVSGSGHALYIVCGYSY